MRQHFYWADIEDTRQQIWELSDEEDIYVAHDQLAQQHAYFGADFSERLLVGYIMEDLGMVISTGEPKPPDVADFGVPMAGEEPDFTAPQGLAYLAALESYLEAPDPQGRPGIPLWKLNDNSGWLILPEEIAGAFAQYEERGAPPLTEKYDRWDEWLAFLRAAGQHGGFRSY